MGYTTYFNQKRNFANSEWVSIKDFAEGLFKELPGVLGDLMGDGGEPEASMKRVAFNGIGDESYESFVIKRNSAGGYNFCKTGEKEYDKAVVAVLCYINHIAPDVFEITSDGMVNDWLVGCELGSKVAGVDLKVPPLIKESYR